MRLKTPVIPPRNSLPDWDDKVPLTVIHPVPRLDLAALARFDLAVHRDKFLCDQKLFLTTGSGKAGEFEELAQLDRLFSNQDCLNVIHAGDLSPDRCRNQTRRERRRGLPSWGASVRLNAHEF